MRLVQDMVRQMGLYVFLPFLVCLLIPLMSQAEVINVGTWKTAQTIQPFYYDKFIPPGDRIQVFTFTNPADQKVALLAGSLSMCGTTLAHAIHSASKGQPVVLVASLCNKCSALVVRKNSSINTIKDLEGKKTGYVPGTMHEILLREALKKNGLIPEKDVKLVRVDFFDMGMALARGSIDAFLSGEPFPTIAVTQGYGRILSYPYYKGTIGTINAGMLVLRKTINNKPQLVYKLVLAHAKATCYLNGHKDEWLKRASSFGTSFSILKKAASNMELSWWMDRDFINRAKALGARMQALGLIDQQPDYDALFDLSFVTKVKSTLEHSKGLR